LESKKLSDYWIGDDVMLKKSGRKGTFEGIHSSGKARIKIESGIILSNADNIVEIDLEPTSHSPIDIEERDVATTKTTFKNEIDLHKDALGLDSNNHIPLMILQKQVAACREYVNQAISLYRREVTIIHGKGTGQLKLEVENLLKEYDEVQYTQSIHEGGALLVGFRYV